MADISNITQYILQKAEDEKLHIIAKAQKEYNDAMDKAKSDASAEYDALIESANAESEKIMQSAQNSVARKKKNNILLLKNKAISVVLQTAKDKILSQSQDEYMEFISLLIMRNATGECGTIIFNSKDRGILTGGVKKTIESKNLVVDDTTRDIDGGFVLKYGYIELNCSIDALMEEKKEQFVDYINNNLFK